MSRRRPCRCPCPFSLCRFSPRLLFIRKDEVGGVPRRPAAASLTRDEVSVAPCQSMAACLLGRFRVQLCARCRWSPASPVGFGGGPAALGSEPEGQARSVS